MTTAQTISSLAAQGVCLKADGDKLLVEAPADLLTDDLRSALLAQKAELLADVREHELARRIVQDLAQLRPYMQGGKTVWINPRYLCDLWL